MHTQTSDLTEIEMKLFGCTLPDVQKKIRQAHLGKLWAILESDYANHSLTLSRAARSICLSPDHMNETLRRACGFTFRQLLIRMRLLAAIRTLKANPTTGVGRLAVEVGFTDPSPFRRQFKRRLGLTASEFRRRAS